MSYEHAKCYCVFVIALRVIPYVCNIRKPCFFKSTCMFSSLAPVNLKEVLYILLNYLVVSPSYLLVKRFSRGIFIVSGTN